MPIKISIADARKNFADIVNKVACGDGAVILTRRGQGVVALVSIAELEWLQQIEDHMDIKDAKKALGESGDNLLAEDVWRQLGF